MLIKLPETVKDLYFVGDIHGNLELIKYYINSYHIKNSAIFICGDVGMGFQPKWERAMIDYINKKLVLTNCFVIAVHGNHDNPLCFQDTELFKKNGDQINWLNVPDYSVINVANKNVLCVGGAISVDRTWRLEKGYGYWENEQIIYQPKVNEKVDIIVTHSAPTFCYPFTKGDFVMEYAKNDSTLLEDMQIERETLTKVWEDYKDTITHWYYGHYHQTNMQHIDNVWFKLLGIGEIVMHYNYDNDSVEDCS